MKPLQLGYPRTPLRRQLVDAVLRGEKRATAGLPDGAPAGVGERFLLHGYDDEPVGVVEVTEARVVAAAERSQIALQSDCSSSLPDDAPIEVVHFRLTDLIVDGRYRGPAHSGHGGYTSGLLAGLLGGSDVEVTLRIPPPLDTPLRIDGASLYHRETLVAEATRTTVELELPTPPASVEAGPADPDHPFPGCFTCGPARDDGLGLFPRAYGELVAAPWQPRNPSREHVWAALDCPGAFAVNPSFERGITVLGRLAAHVEEVPEDGEELVVVGWPLAGGDARRSYAGTCLFRGTQPLAWARATWFAVKDEFRDPLPSPA